MIVIERDRYNDVVIRQQNSPAPLLVMNDVLAQQFCTALRRVVEGHRPLQACGGPTAVRMPMLAPRCSVCWDNKVQSDLPCPACQHANYVKFFKEVKQLNVKAHRVLRDKNAVFYIATGAPDTYLCEKGGVVALVAITRRTMSGLAAKPVKHTLLEVAKMLYKPSGSAIQMTAAAQHRLNLILNNTEVVEMATKKKAAKKSSNKKAVSGAGRPRSENAEITLKRMPKDGVEADALPPQAVAILGVLKSNKGKMNLARLIEACKGKVETKQDITHIWAFYRKRLIDGGFVVVDRAEKAA